MERVDQRVLFAVQLFEEFLGRHRGILGAALLAQGHRRAARGQLAQHLIDHRTGHARELGKLVPCGRALAEQSHVGLGLVLGKPNAYQLVVRAVHTW